MEIIITTIHRYLIKERINIYRLLSLFFGFFDFLRLFTSFKILYSQTHKSHKNGIDINCNIRYLIKERINIYRLLSLFFSVFSSFSGYLQVLKFYTPRLINVIKTE